MALDGARPPWPAFSCVQAAEISRSTDVPFEKYFVTESQRASAKQSLVSTESAASFNVLANVSGGGVNGQADAVKLGIARALMLFNADLRKKLKSDGLVSRDSRGKERKKYGQKGARKRFQFSKR